MRRRDFITLFGGAAATWPLAARAQQSGRMRRIGMLIGAAEDDPEAAPRITAFRQSLERLGWKEGHNVRIDYRWGGGDPTRMQTHAKELIGATPDILVTESTPATAALQRETRTTPIVFLQAGNPVGSRFVVSFAHPGGNLTGFTNYAPAMGSKWLEILKEVAPRVTRTAALFNPKTHTGQYWDVLEAASASFSLQFTKAAVEDAAAIARTVETMSGEPSGGLLVMPDSFNLSNRSTIVSLTAHYRVPAIYPFKVFSANGGLISYGSSIVAEYRGAASYVDRILRGEKPADLPVQAPTTFELVINVKAAKALGLDIPPTLLARADEVIE